MARGNQRDKAREKNQAKLAGAVCFSLPDLLLCLFDEPAC